MSEDSKIQHPKKRAFLRAISCGASISKAAVLAKIDRSTHYEWKAQDSAYADAFEKAILQCGDSLEGMLCDEAMDGKNVTAAIFLLKGLKPEKYRERYDNRLANADGSNLPTWDQLLEATRAAHAK